MALAATFRLPQSPAGDKKIKRRHAVGLRLRFGFVSLAAVTVALAVVLSLFYFLQINQLTLSGYQIMDIEQQIKDLRTDNKRLRYEISQRKALSVVDQRAREELHMVVADEVQFWWHQTDGSEVALNQ